MTDTVAKRIIAGLSGKLWISVVGGKSLQLMGAFNNLKNYMVLILLKNR